MVNFRLWQSHRRDHITADVRKLIGSLDADTSGMSRFGDLELMETSPRLFLSPSSAGIPTLFVPRTLKVFPGYNVDLIPRIRSKIDPLISSPASRVHIYPRNWAGDENLCLK